MAIDFHHAQRAIRTAIVGGGSIIGLVLFLAGCTSEPSIPAVAEGQEHIECAVGGSAQIKPVCAVEQVEQDGEPIVIVRHPDGAFRRFDLTKDGYGLAVTDGAVQAIVRLVDGKLEVTVGADRYLFPATETPHDEPSNTPS